VYPAKPSAACRSRQRWSSTGYSLPATMRTKTSEASGAVPDWRSLSIAIVTARDSGNFSLWPAFHLDGLIFEEHDPSPLRGVMEVRR
jgi:hypothetical protein